LRRDGDRKLDKGYPGAPAKCYGAKMGGWLLALGSWLLAIKFLIVTFKLNFIFWRKRKIGTFKFQKKLVPIILLR